MGLQKNSYKQLEPGSYETPENFVQDELVESNKFQSNESESSLNNIAKYITSGIPLLALLTFTTYCLGWSYLSAYYESLGISLESLHLPTITYLKNAIFPELPSMFPIW